MFIENNNYEILTIDGFKDFDGLKISRSKNIIELQFDNGENLICTVDHKIYTTNGKIEAQFLTGQHDIICNTGITKLLYKEHIEKEIDVYDVCEVSDTNSFMCNNISISNCVVLDEYAFVAPNVAEEFFKSVYPTISSGKTSKLFIISTPNGMNHFWKFWKSAERKENDFIPFTAYWWQVPWKDEEWRKHEIANMGSEKDFEQEHGVEFLGAEGTLISGHILAQKMIEETPKENYMGINIYEKPINEMRDSIGNIIQHANKYFITVDVSRGQGLDYHAFIVWDVTTLPYKQVASFRNNEIETMLLPNILASIGYHYNTAQILIESNVASEVGALLHRELEYPEILWTKKDKKKTIKLTYSGGGRNLIGVVTNYNVKAIGCSTLKSLIENDQIKIVDRNTISEFTTFVAKGKTFEAQQGQHDDLVMCGVLFGWATRDPLFQSLIDTDARGKIVELRDEEQRIAETLPFGFRKNVHKTNLSTENMYSDGRLVWHIVR